ncbi:MAG: hypothetical protein ACXWID_13775 [Pyrinomonadaceae bacterium]
MSEDRTTSDQEKEKEDKEKKDKNILSDDPPIIVGGGGSTLIWIKKNTNPKLVAPPPAKPGIPPANPDNYYVFECKDLDIKKISAKDGKGGGSDHANIEKDKHRTAFDE